MEQAQVCMIIEDYFNSEVSKYREKYLDKLKNTKVVDIPIKGMNLSTLNMALESIKQLQSKAMLESIPDISFSLEEIIMEYSDKEKRKYEKEIDNINEKYNEYIKKRKEEFLSNMEHTTNEVNTVREKHKELMCYKEILNNTMERYNISPSSINIKDNISMEELSALIDTSIDICKEYLKEDKDLISKLFKEDPKKEDIVFTLSLFLIGVFILSPLLLSIYVYILVSKTKYMYSNIDKLRIAESMMFEFDYDKFIPNEDVDISDIEELRKEEIDSISSNNEESVRNIFVREWSKLSDKLEDTQYSLRLEISSEQDRIYSEYSAQISKLEKAIEDIISELVPFGTNINDSQVLCRDFKIYEEYQNCYITENYGMKNILVSTSIEYEKRTNYIKLLLWNFLLNVKEKCLYLYIYDPENLGRDFYEFMDKEYKEYSVLVNDEDLEKTIKEFNNTIRNNVRVLGKRNIDEYNKEAYDVGKVTKDYIIMACLSGIDDKNIEVVGNMLPYSAEYGVQFILATNNFNFDNCVTISNLKNNIIECDSTLGERCKSTYKKVFLDSKPKPLLYKKEFENKVCPTDKIWKHSTIKGIELNFGLADGDPSEYYPIVLGDANPHCLMVGASGSGKSAAITQMLMSLVLKYPPSELEMVMVDFKNVEFSKLSNDGISILPHASILSGTTDGEYALSIFEFLLDEMNRRKRICAQYGEVNLEDYRTKHPEAPIMPRILVLVDEFQVPFTTVDKKILDKIIVAIINLAKLARAFGCHLWFTSQSMKGTLDKDIMDQFTLRVALRCSSQTSNDIIGHDAAAKWIKTSYGYLVTNTASGEDPSRSTLWKIPFVETSEVIDTLNYLKGLKDDNSKSACFYDEKIKPNSSLMFDTVKSNDVFLNKNNIILGERAKFSTNLAPVNFNLSKATGENVFIIANETYDQLNLARTILDNAVSKDIQFLINCADDSNHRMLEVEKLVCEDLIHTTYSDFGILDIIDLVSDLLELRKENNVTTTMYFILMNWDEKIGYGRNENFGAIASMDNLLMDAPKYGIHFILICRNIGEIKTKALNLFNHKIAAICSDVDSSKVLNSVAASKLPTVGEDCGNFAIYRRQSVLSKFKIYQHTFDVELEECEIVI